MSMLTATIPKVPLIAVARKALMAMAKTAQVTMKTVPLNFSNQRNKLIYICLDVTSLSTTSTIHALT